MELFYGLWTFAPTVKSQLAIFAVLAQVGITIWCYNVMSTARIEAYKDGKIDPEMYRATSDAEPEDLRVYTRLVANQFESPVLFYALVLAGLAVGITSWITVFLAFAYVIIRWMHAQEMTGEHVVLRRRKIFIRSMQVLGIMVAELAISTLLFIQV